MKCPYCSQDIAPNLIRAEFARLKRLLRRTRFYVGIYVAPEGPGMDTAREIRKQTRLVRDIDKATRGRS